MTTADGSVFPALAAVLEQELALLESGRTSMVLVHGERVGALAGMTYYRFEAPEDVLIRSIETATFTFGRVKPIDVAGNIIAVENQFLTAALPYDFGPTLPEVRISWNYRAQFQPVIDAVRGIGPANPIPKLLLRPADPSNVHVVPIEPVSPPQTPPEQAEALTKILRTRVSLVLGPILSGKTRLLACVAANYVKSGKRVLFVSPGNDQVDAMLLRTVEVGTLLGVDMTTSAVRYDLPTIEAAERITPYSFDHQLNAAKEEKRKVFHERVTLLATYWNVRAKHILHEDFYHRVQEMRERVAELRRQADAASKEATQIQQQLQQLQNASIIDRMKKGFSKEEQAAAQKALAEKQQAAKRLQQTHQSLSSEITRIELHAPVSAEETMAYNAAAKRIDELGGPDNVRKAVEEFTAVDEAPLLAEKRFTATSVTTALMDPLVKGHQYDLVIVDEAQAVNIPTLTALAAMAKEKLVVAGDPFQLEPDSLLNNDAARMWLQRDIFLFLAGTDELPRLFDWATKNAQWCTFLTSHFASTPKLSLFMGSVVFDDKITVFASPKARGKIFFIDTSADGARTRQYFGKRKILPYNELHTRKTIECVKHALIDGKRTAGDVGVILPFAGPTLFTKWKLRAEGLGLIEVGTPQSFRERRKKAIVFDTTAAGTDHTLRQVDDRKVGEHRLIRLFATVFSCVDEDLYVVADMTHFRTVYKDRLVTRMLMLLQAEADQKQPSFFNAVTQFDNLDRRARAAYQTAERSSTTAPAPKSTEPDPLKDDFELQMQKKILARKEAAAPAPGAPRNFERELGTAVERILALRRDINLLSQYGGGDLVFRNSFATEEAATHLPVDQVAAEKDFRSVIERWHLLLYEMAGGNAPTNPLLAHKGKESRARQDVRFLNAFYAGNVGAVLDEGKGKIAMEVSKIFQELIGKPQPGNPTEWATAYAGLLGRFEAYLSWMSEQLRK